SSSESKDTFDHSHTGRVRDADFSSRKNIEGKILRPNKRGASNSSSSTDKEDGKWNDIKANNLLMQRLRQRLQLTVDPRLSNPLGQVTYDGLREETIDIDLSYQKRVDEKSMSLNLKVNVPQKNLISIKYDETIRSNTSFNGVLKYPFNANDSTAEKTYQCDVNQPYVDSYSMKCQGERTNLTIDIDPVAHKKKFIVDLNRLTGERIGYETAMKFTIGELETTYYTLVTSWNMKYRVEVLLIIIVKQKDLEVLRITTSRADFAGFKIRFLPANIEIKEFSY
ncbi:unnamed protein product, partial [Rotaria magnacalcarata]